MITRRRNGELKLAKKRTGNFTPPPALTEREKKIISVIGTESSEGLGFGEGSISPLQQKTVEINIEEDEYLISEIEEDHAMDEVRDEDTNNEKTFDNEIAEVSGTSHNEKEDFSKKSNISAGKSRPKVSQEQELFKNLIQVNSDGLLAIAAALELVAASNNNIADSIRNLRCQI